MYSSNIWKGSSKISRHCFFFSFFFFFLGENWIFSDWTAENFSSLFCFCFFFFFIFYSISRRIVVKSDKKDLTGWVRFPECTVKNFSSLFCFCFFLLYIIPYLARDSCKKWQEKLSRLGLISRALFYCFVLFLYSLSAPYRSGRSKISRHYFVFVFFSFSYTLISRG